MSIPRSPESRLRGGLLVLLLAVFSAQADELNAGVERERIARERAQVEATARERERTCAREFAVSACVDAARRERTEQLRQLERQRALLDEAERKRRAAAREVALRNRREAAASTPPPTEVRTRNAKVTSGSGAEGPVAVRSAPVDSVARAEAQARAASAADRIAATRASAAAARASEAKGHRRMVEQRNRERALQRKPAAPLPLPAGASAPR